MGAHKWPVVIYRDRGFMKDMALKLEAVSVAESRVCLAQVCVMSTS